MVITKINNTLYEANAIWNHWKQDNKELYKQLTQKCAGCGKIGKSGFKDLHIHHKDGDRRNNELSNLVCLCYNCHKLAHKVMFVKYKVIV